jgi:hypothetical protein
MEERNVSIKMRNACRKLRVPPAQKAVLMAMADYADDTGAGIYPAVDTIAEDTCFSRRAVQDAVAALAALEVLVCTKRSRGGRKQTNEHSINLERVAALIACPPAKNGKRKQRKNRAPAAPFEVPENHAAGAYSVNGNHAAGALYEEGNRAGGAINRAPAAPDSSGTLRTEESNNVGVISDSPEGVQGEGRDRHRQSWQWSPKVDDPRQLDLITDTALGESTPAPVEVLVPESIVPPVALSLEGEVMPPEAPVAVPEVIPASEAAPAPAPAKRSNVVKLHPDTDPDFQRWYATYPRHKKPIDAAKAYAEARRRASASELLEGAHRCREEADALPPEKRRFVPYPASWLRAGGWMEEAEGVEVNSIEGRGNGKHYDNRRETGPNVNARVFAAILERIAEGS